MNELELAYFQADDSKMEQAFERSLPDDLRRDYQRWREKRARLVKALHEVLCETRFTFELHSNVRLIEKDLTRNVYEGLHWRDAQVRFHEHHPPKMVVPIR
jgi:hypothetical protein